MCIWGRKGRVEGRAKCRARIFLRHSLESQFVVQLLWKRTTIKYLTEKKKGAILIQKNIGNMEEPYLKQYCRTEQARTCWRSWQKISHNYCSICFTGCHWHQQRVQHWLRAADPDSNAVHCAAALLCTGWLRTVKILLFQRCYPDSSFTSSRILWSSTDSHNSELWAHMRAGSAHREARVPVKHVSGWR